MEDEGQMSTDSVTDSVIESLFESLGQLEGAQDSNGKSEQRSMSAFLAMEVVCSSDVMLAVEAERSSPYSSNTERSSFDQSSNDAGSMEWRLAPAPASNHPSPPHPRNEIDVLYAAVGQAPAAAAAAVFPHPPTAMAQAMAPAPAMAQAIAQAIAPAPAMAQTMAQPMAVAMAQSPAISPAMAPTPTPLHPFPPTGTWASAPASSSAPLMRSLQPLQQTSHQTMQQQPQQPPQPQQPQQPQPRAHHWVMSDRTAPASLSGAPAFRTMLNGMLQPPGISSHPNRQGSNMHANAPGSNMHANAQGSSMHATAPGSSMHTTMTGMQACMSSQACMPTQTGSWTVHDGQSFATQMREKRPREHPQPQLQRYNSLPTAEPGIHALSQPPPQRYQPMPLSSAATLQSMSTVSQAHGGS